MTTKQCRSSEGDADKSIILESNQGHLSKVLHRRNQAPNHPNQDQRNLLFHIIQDHKAIRARLGRGNANANEAFQVQNISKTQRNERIQQLQMIMYSLKTTQNQACQYLKAFLITWLHRALIQP